MVLHSSLTAASAEAHRRDLLVAAERYRTAKAVRRRAAPRRARARRTAAAWKRKSRTKNVGTPCHDERRGAAGGRDRARRAPSGDGGARRGSRARCRGQADGHPAGRRRGGRQVPARHRDGRARRRRGLRRAHRSLSRFVGLAAVPALHRGRRPAGGEQPRAAHRAPRAVAAVARPPLRRGRRPRAGAAPGVRRDAVGARFAHREVPRPAGDRGPALGRPVHPGPARVPARPAARPAARSSSPPTGPTTCTGGTRCARCSPSWSRLPAWSGSSSPLHAGRAARLPRRDPRAASRAGSSALRPLRGQRLLRRGAARGRPGRRAGAAAGLADVLLPGWSGCRPGGAAGRPGRLGRRPAGRATAAARRRPGCRDDELEEALREAVTHHVLVADGGVVRVPARAAAGGRLRRPAAGRAGPAARDATRSCSRSGVESSARRAGPPLDGEPRPAARGRRSVQAATEAMRCTRRSRRCASWSGRCSSGTRCRTRSGVPA